jgi:hypothetical protein
MRTDFSHTMMLQSDPVYRADLLQKAYKLRVVEWDEIVDKASLDPNILIPLEPRGPDITRLCTLMQIEQESLTPQQLNDIDEIFSR